MQIDSHVPQGVPSAFLRVTNIHAPDRKPAQSPVVADQAYAAFEHNAYTAGVLRAAERSTAKIATQLASHADL